jgi:hypothetical protein
MDLRKLEPELQLKAQSKARARENRDARAAKMARANAEATETSIPTEIRRDLSIVEAQGQQGT